MSLYYLLLIIHVGLGSVGLISGTINTIRKKGDRLHRRIGLLFYYSMIIMAISALCLCLMNKSSFLFLIGIFTLYMTLSGRRYLKLKKLDSGMAAGLKDYILTCGMLLFGLLFLGMGLTELLSDRAFGTVYIVFAGIGIMMVFQDFRNYRGYSKIKNQWMLCHLQRMIGSFIAALTAFLVVNNNILPGIVAWLLPTIILVPVIILLSQKLQILSDPNPKP